MPFSITIPPPVPRRTRDNDDQHHSFRRLRSFYLSPSPTKAEFGIGILSPISGPATPASSTSAPSTPQSAVFSMHASSSQPQIASGSAGPSMSTSAVATADSCSERTLREGAGYPGSGSAGGSGANTVSAGMQRRCRKISSLYLGNTAINGSVNGGRWMRSRRIGKLRGAVVMIWVVVLSVFLVGCLSLSFVGASVSASGDAGLRKVLDGIAGDDPGLVLVGENVDVDIDEPSVEIRWSIASCGEGLALPGSTGVLGSKDCGLPIEGLDFFVDGRETPAATYDPTLMPYQRSTSQRRSIESLTHFTTTHTLDVHTAYLYPFDKYTLSVSLRAVRSGRSISPSLLGGSLAGRLNPNGTVAGTAVRISKVVVVGGLAGSGSFNVEGRDVESYVVLAGREEEEEEEDDDDESISTLTATVNSSQTSNSTITTPHTSISTITVSPSPSPPPEKRQQERRRLLRRKLALALSATSAEAELVSQNVPADALSCRDLDLHITRPPSAQVFVFFLFTVAWVLVHLSVGLVVILRRRRPPFPYSHRFGDTLSGGALTLLMLVGVLGTVVALRRSMPDAPGMDGVLVDCIGYFPQVIVLGLCIATVLFTIAAREIDDGAAPHQHPLNHEHYHRQEEEERERESSYYYQPRESTLLDSDHPPRRHTHQNHCRASIISSFPQPPSTTPLSPFPSGRRTACTLRCSPSSGAELGPHCSPWHFPRGSGSSLSPMSPPMSPMSPTSTTASSRAGRGFGFASALWSPPSSPRIPRSGPWSTSERKMKKKASSAPTSTGESSLAAGESVEMRSRKGSSVVGEGHRRARTESVRVHEDEREVSRWSDHEED